MSTNDIVISAAGRILPASHAQAFTGTIQGLTYQVSRHEAIELIGQMQDIVGTPAARNEAHKAINRVQGLRV